MSKKVVLIFLLSLFFLIPFKKVSAGSNFSTDYNVTYQVLNNANAHVRLNIVLTNLSAKYYSPSYKLSFGFTDISNVTGYDSNGKLNLDVSETDKGTSIEFDFNKAVTGEGNKQNFTLEFNTDEIAQNYGNVWDINIPGISQGDDFASFNATVVYPSFLGKPAFIKPDIPGKNNVSGNAISFNKDELGRSGISLAFGSSQNYEFNLKYHLQNKNLFPIKTEIALPPDTNYQNVLINSITPSPVNVKIDQDGNWLAEYLLSPSQNLNILVNGKAQVMLNGKQQVLTENQKAKYLKQQQYWEVHSVNINQKAKQLKTPEQIYQYVVGALTYDFSRASDRKPRLGASAVLNDPNSAVCLEFADLFVTLARASGIPARELDGYAVTNNSQARPLSLTEDVLHAWPEYYDFEKNKWIMVDPTWGNTTGGVDYFNTFDFDHIVFAIHGARSDYPVPAGGYKVGAGQKDVEIKLTKNFEKKQLIDIEVERSGFNIPFIENTGQIMITNKGNSLIQGGVLQIYSEDLGIEGKTITIDQIPPSGIIETPFSFLGPFTLTSKAVDVRIVYAGKTFEEKLILAPFYLSYLFLGGVTFVILIIVISILARRSRGVPIS